MRRNSLQNGPKLLLSHVRVQVTIWGCRSIVYIRIGRTCARNGKLCQTYDDDNKYTMRLIPKRTQRLLNGARQQRTKVAQY